MKHSIVLLLSLAMAGTAAAREVTPSPALSEADREVLTRIVVDTWASHVDGEQRQRWLEHVEARAQSAPLEWLETAAAALDLRSADLALDGAAPLDHPTPAAFGSAGGNLVFTPLAPCRLLDTRQDSPRSGIIEAYSERSFLGFGLNFRNFQGGDPSDCGLTNVAPEALAITLAAVNPAGDGYLTAYPAGSEQPLAATLNYVAGQVTSTGAILPINSSIVADEFVIYSRRDSHVVADVVGYFARPQATALECTNLAGATTTLPANGVNFAQSPECPDTSTAMLGSCLILSPNAILVSHTLDPDTQRTTCVFRNSGGTPENFRAESQCCRIPGR